MSVSLGIDSSRNQLDPTKVFNFSQPTPFGRALCKLEKIGTGGSGNVYKALSDTNHLFALKKTSIKELSQHEFHIGHSLNCDTAMKVYGMFEVVKNNKLRSYLVMEYVQGETLEDFLKTSRLRPSQVNYYINQILSTIKFCIRKGVFPQDLTTKNIMITPQGKIKLIDFGMYQFLEALKKNENYDTENEDMELFSRQIFELICSLLNSCKETALDSEKVQIQSERLEHFMDSFTAELNAENLLFLISAAINHVKPLLPPAHRESRKRKTPEN